MKINNEKGVLLITSAFLIIVLTGASAMFFGRSINEMKMVEREMDRLEAYCAAEAGFQGALSEIGTTNYSGFINTSNFASVGLSINGNEVSRCSATKTLISDNCIIIQSTGISGTGYYMSRSLQVRIALESVFSKYFLFADTGSFSSGTNSQYAEPLLDVNDEDGDGDTTEILVDANGRARVDADDDERALMYFRGDWDIDGEGVKLYGNAFVEGDLQVTQNKDDLDVHGDTYVQGNYVSNGQLVIDDTYDDGNDQHVLTNAEAEGALPAFNTTFYQNVNSIPSFGTSPTSRNLEFVPSDDGTYTIVNEYNNRNYSNLINSYHLPSNAIIYVNGDACIKGTIAGKVTLYTSDDLHIQGSLTYNNGLDHADENHSAAYLAGDVIYFNDQDMTAEGIFYAGQVSNSGHANDASRTLDGELDLGGKNCFTLIGNRILKGNSFMGHYAHRLYLYDPYLRNNPPPGLPVSAKVISVREI
ncbi:MAG: hypothetical protein KKH94_10400 [Candidatus Omnitrophica bacterium]|nr:hypothetical protein [Candidatus Omnitrophota bacterium]